MQVGKAKMGFKESKEVDGDCGVFHRGQGGRRARGVARRRRAIETRVRQQGQRLCREW